MSVSKTVLVVDDDPQFFFFVRRALKGKAYAPQMALNGVEAAQMAQSGLPDAILLNIKMPLMGGFDFLKDLQKMEGGEDVPVIMTTEADHSDDVRRALGMGAIDFIRKPVSGVELLARLRLAIQLREQAARLQELLALKDNFVSIVAHDLRAPFQSIIGYADLLLHEETNNPLNDSQKHMIGIILANGQKQLDYLSKLLNLARLDKGRFDLTPKRVRLYPLIKDVLSLFRGPLGSKKIAVDINVPRQLKISVDPVLFGQVLQNLFSNAVKFSPHGGRIETAVRKKNHRTVLSVYNSGRVIPTDMRKNLLKESINASTLGTAGEIGTGLGLAIVRRIIDAHGFSIKLDGRCRSGVRFLITFS